MIGPTHRPPEPLTADQRTLVLGIVMLWLCLTPILGLLYLTVPPSPDQSQFDYMAWLALQGVPYYAGSFDMNWPGAMLLHEAGIRLFGVEPWTWRATDFLLIQSSALASALFLMRAEWRIAAALVLVLAPLLTVTAGGWMAGQRDIVAAGFLIVAAAATVPGGRTEALRVFLAGLAIAAAVLVRPTYLSFLAGLLLLEALPLRTMEPRSLWRPGRAILLVTGFATGVGAVFLAGLAAGVVDDWVDMAFRFSLSIYVGDWAQDPLTTLRSFFIQSSHWIVALSLLGLALWFWRYRLDHALAVLLGLGATFAVSFAVQNKGFGYHLAGFVPLLAMGVAVALDGLLRLRSRASGPRRTALTVAVAGSLGLVLAGSLAKLENLHPNARQLLAGEIAPIASDDFTEAERRALVDRIRRNSGPEDTIAQYGTHYDLLYRSERLAAHRFFTPAADQIQPDFALYDEWMGEIRRALQDRPPVFVLFDRSHVTGPAEALEPEEEGRPILTLLLDHVAEGYRPVYDEGPIVLFQREAAPVGAILSEGTQ